MGNGFKCYSFPKLRAVPKKNIRIGNNVTFGYNCTLEITPNGKLTIEDGVNITQNVLISSNEEIIIGAKSLIGENVSLRDSDHGTERSIPIQLQQVKSSKIKIEEDVWIGANSIILRGSHLKKGVVIGANSLVNKNSNTEEYCLYAGSPVQKIKERK